MSNEEFEYVDLGDPYAEPEQKKKKFVEYPKDENGNTIWPKQKQRGPRKNPFIKFDEEGELIPLTEVQIEKLKASAMNSCMWHLGQGNKTRKELKDKLILKELPEDIIEETLDRLTEMKYINDEHYAESFVYSKQSFGNKGKGAIRQELRRKGVDSEIIETTLEAVSDEDERERATELVKKKLPSTRNLDRQKRMNRLVGMLSRKGYAGNIVFSVIKECLDEEAAEALDPDYDPAEEFQG
jgi:regulatory protein